MSVGGRPLGHGGDIACGLCSGRDSHFTDRVCKQLMRAYQKTRAAESPTVNVLIEALYGARLDAPLSPATAASVQIAASTGELCFLCGRAEHEESGSAREAAVWGSLCGPGGCAFLVGFVRDTKRFPRIAEGEAAVLPALEQLRKASYAHHAVWEGQGRVLPTDKAARVERSVHEEAARSYADAAGTPVPPVSHGFMAGQVEARQQQQQQQQQQQPASQRSERGLSGLAGVMLTGRGGVPLARDAASSTRGRGDSRARDAAGGAAAVAPRARRGRDLPLRGRGRGRGGGGGRGLGGVSALSSGGGGGRDGSVSPGGAGDVLRDGDTAVPGRVDAWPRDGASDGDDVIGGGSDSADGGGDGAPDEIAHVPAAGRDSLLVKVLTVLISEITQRQRAARGAQALRRVLSEPADDDERESTVEIRSLLASLQDRFASRGSDVDLAHVARQLDGWTGYIAALPALLSGGLIAKECEEYVSSRKDDASSRRRFDACDLYMMRGDSVLCDAAMERIGVAYGFTGILAQLEPYSRADGAAVRLRTAAIEDVFKKTFLPSDRVVTRSIVVNAKTHGFMHGLACVQTSEVFAARGIDNFFVQDSRDSSSCGSIAACNVFQEPVVSHLLVKGLMRARLKLLRDELGATLSAKDARKLLDPTFTDNTSNPLDTAALMLVFNGNSLLGRDGLLDSSGGAVYVEHGAQHFVPGASFAESMAASFGRTVDSLVGASFIIYEHKHFYAVQNVNNSLTDTREWVILNGVGSTEPNVAETPAVESLLDTDAHTGIILLDSRCKLRSDWQRWYKNITGEGAMHMVPEAAAMAAPLPRRVAAQARKTSVSNSRRTLDKRKAAAIAPNTGKPRGGAQGAGMGRKPPARAAAAAAARDEDEARDRAGLPDGESDEASVDFLDASAGRRAARRDGAQHNECPCGRAGHAARDCRQCWKCGGWLDVCAAGKTSAPGGDPCPSRARSAAVRASKRRWSWGRGSGGGDSPGSVAAAVTAGFRALADLLRSLPAVLAAGVAAGPQCGAARAAAARAVSVQSPASRRSSRSSLSAVSPVWMPTAGGSGGVRVDDPDGRSAGGVSPSPAAQSVIDALSGTAVVEDGVTVAGGGVDDPKAAVASRIAKMAADLRAVAQLRVRTNAGGSQEGGAVAAGSEGRVLGGDTAAVVVADASSLSAATH